MELMYSLIICYGYHSGVRDVGGWGLEPPSPSTSYASVPSFLIILMKKIVIKYFSMTGLDSLGVGLVGDVFFCIRVLYTQQKTTISSIMSRPKPTNSPTDTPTIVPILVDDTVGEL